jgi:hypothetical protein
VVVLPTAVFAMLVLPTLVVVLPTAVFATLVRLMLVVVLPTAVFATFVFAILPVVVATLAPRPAMVAVLAAVLPATFGLMRAVMLGVRELLILRLGVRMMLCAYPVDPLSEINTIATAIGAAAARPAIRRLSSRPFNEGPP